MKLKSVSVTEKKVLWDPHENALNVEDRHQSVPSSRNVGGRATLCAGAALHRRLVAHQQWNELNENLHTYNKYSVLKNVVANITCIYAFSRLEVLF